MLDPKRLRNELEAISSRLATRGFTLDSEQFAALEQQRKALQVQAQTLQNLRNTKSKAIGQAKAAGEDISSLREEVNGIGDELKQAQAQADAILTQLQDLQMSMPNLPHDSVPAGKDEDDNVQVRAWGEPRQFSFTAKEHDELGTALGQFDFENAGKITGSRFMVMHADLAQMHRALIQFMLDTHTREHGYQEVYVPYIVNQDSLYGTGQLPKFAEDQFALQGDHDYYLIPTAEVPVTNLLRDTITAASELPLQFVCHSPCFRSEAGSYGKDTRGIIRQHQFEKVECVWAVQAEQSYAALDALTGHAEAILQKLELPYRVMLLCTGDMGFSAAKTYDIEVWLPGQQRYREISSCSNCEDFQARRMQARWRAGQGDKPELLHTLNGSGLAVGRTLVAILENYQREDGSIGIPTALQPYMNGKTEISHRK